MKFLKLAPFILTAIMISSPVHAGLFTFSFNNEDSNVDGTVSGDFLLPNGDGVFSATALNITSAPLALGYALPINAFDPTHNILENAFTVNAGNIDFSLSNFFVVFSGSNTAFALNGTEFGAAGASFLDANPAAFLGTPGVLDADSSSLTASVPEPGSLALLGLGLIGLGSLKRKQQ